MRSIGIIAGSIFISVGLQLDLWCTVAVIVGVATIAACVTKYEPKL